MAGSMVVRALAGGFFLPGILLMSKLPLPDAATAPQMPGQPLRIPYF